MMKLEVLMLLLNQAKSDPKPSKLPDSEYIEVGILPIITVSKVYYTDFLNYNENLKTSINNINLVVTQTGLNPL